MKIQNNIYPQLYVDITHRCNMHCNICYAEKRHLPDISLDYFKEVCKRLPSKVIIRLAGGEPTLHKNCLEFLKIGHEYGHVVSLVTNGKKLADYNYVKELKGLGIPVGVAISFDGGISNNEVYQIVNNEPAAEFKMQALENLVRFNFRRIGVCAILIRGLNEFVIGDLIKMQKMYPKHVRIIHIRPMSRIGRWIDTEPYSLTEIKDEIRARTNLVNAKEIKVFEECHGCKGCDRFTIQNYEVGLIGFPYNNCKARGQLRENFEVEPFFINMDNYDNKNIIKSSGS